MTMTKKDALTIAISNMETSTEPVDLIAVEVLRGMVAQLSKPRTPASEEARAKMNAKRKEQTAKAREELIAKVVPVLRKYLTTDITAKELFTKAQEELPTDFSAPKIQNILLREMAEEVIKTEAKGKANTYRLK